MSCKINLNVSPKCFILSAENLSEYINFIVKPNFKEVGKIFGKNIKEYTTKLLELTNEEIVKLQNNESIKMTIDNVEYDITNSMVDIRIESKDGFNVGMANNEFVILNIELTEELLNKAIAAYQKDSSLFEQDDEQLKATLQIEDDDIIKALRENKEAVMKLSDAQEAQARQEQLAA